MGCLTMDLCPKLVKTLLIWKSFANVKSILKSLRKLFFRNRNGAWIALTFTHAQRQIGSVNKTWKTKMKKVLGTKMAATARSVGRGWWKTIVRWEQCDQIGRNFATLAKVYKSLADFWQFVYYLPKCWAYFGKFVILLGLFKLLQMAKYWKLI